MKPMSEEYATKWVKDMKQIKVVKRRGQNEHGKQGDEQKQIHTPQQ